MLHHRKHPAMNRTPTPTAPTRFPAVSAVSDVRLYQSPRDWLAVRRHSEAEPTNKWQTCTVGAADAGADAGAAGTIGTASVTSVAVVCTTNKVAVGVNVAGVAGSGLVLQSNYLFATLKRDQARDHPVPAHHWIRRRAELR